MLKSLVLLIIIITIRKGESKGGIEEKKVDKFFLGKWYLVYVWPEADRKFPNCLKVVYKEWKYRLPEPFTCNCTNNNTDLVFIKQMSKGVKTILLADIVQDPTDVQAALDKVCKCVPYIKYVDAVIRKLSDDCFLYYEVKLNLKYTYLFCNYAPMYDEDVYFKINAIERTNKEFKHHLVFGKKLCPADFDDNAKAVVKDY